MAQEQVGHLKHSLDEVRHAKEELYCQFSKTRYKNSVSCYFSNFHLIEKILREIMTHNYTVS